MQGKVGRGTRKSRKRATHRVEKSFVFQVPWKSAQARMKTPRNDSSSEVGPGIRQIQMTTATIPIKNDRN
ncbi:unnamed protein product [Bursaphelenchus xylophilus]|uniref:(pine wood nematode) hypothetical protein n=1 Tax=Bursaphelenchus xylophilus TaxID=6326 RepID=A0A7I8XDY2_BURXY|nr:unnamed protein product [Bursaphelenchus xylophilus]CAG9113126.1 unnamed protein product [Bursaphelenchus xylophilus]